MPWEKQFDKNEVLCRAERAFWSGGYEATSMADLLEQMGIQKGSFYATFGSKRRILLDALEAYIRNRFTAFGALTKEKSPCAALERHLRQLADEAAGPAGNWGCFVVNTALELAPRDEEVRALVQRTFDAHVKLYCTLLDAAKAKGEVNADLDSPQTAWGLHALVLGMRVLSRASMPRAAIYAVRDQALGLLGKKPVDPA